MDLGKFVSLLSSEALYFACPCEFNDPFEGFYPKSHIQTLSSMLQQYLDQMLLTRDQLIAKYPGIDINGLNDAIENARERFIKSVDELRLKFGVSCWHKNDAESEAMWKLYATSGNGIAIESTENQLRQSMIGSQSLVIDDVSYVDFENSQIQKALKHIGMFQKRKSFEHERELRATVLLKKEGKGEFVRCNVDTLITKVHISPFAPRYLKEAVDNICSGSVRRLCKPVLQSSLFDKPNEDFKISLKGWSDTR